MWGPKSPLPKLWLQLFFWYMSGAILASIYMGLFVFVPVVVCLGILMYAFNAFDLKMDKGKYSKKKSRLQ